MCGIAGYAGVTDIKRPLLAYALGVGIDSRGGHASGAIAIQPNLTTRRRSTNLWSHASKEMMRFVYQSRLVAMHARFATHGEKIKENAHPFLIKRNGQSALLGMHNGVIWDASSSSEEHERKCSVDSEELFHLLTDREYDKIGELSGYGSVAYVRAEDPNRIRLCRISDDGELVYANLKEGGMVYASTKYILMQAIDTSGLDVKGDIEEPEAGTVMALDERGRISVVDDEYLYLPSRWNELKKIMGKKELTQEEWDWVYNYNEHEVPKELKEKIDV